MTVCIAALYGNGSGVVVASDRMVTAHIPMGFEFEYDERAKIVEMDDETGVYALIAGDVLRGYEIVELAKSKLTKDNGGGFTASHIAEVIRAAYQNIRLKTIVENEIEPRGLDLNSFLR